MLYPLFGNTAGYNSPLYGQAGLEAGLDNYLRGLSGNPSSLIMLQNLLSGQTPPGLDVRLTIDLAIQKRADELLQGSPRRAGVDQRAQRRNTGDVFAARF